VRIEELVLIARGAYAWGRTETKAKKRFDIGDKLRVFVTAAYAVNGTEVQLRGDTSAEGQRSCSEEGCAFFIFVPWVKGGEAVIPKGTKVTAYTQEDISFDVADITKSMADVEARKAQEITDRRGSAVVHRKVLRLSQGDGRCARLGFAEQDTLRPPRRPQETGGLPFTTASVVALSGLPLACRTESLAVSCRPLISGLPGYEPTLIRHRRGSGRQSEGHLPS